MTDDLKLHNFRWCFKSDGPRLTRYVVIQRQDGLFSEDIIGGKGQYWLRHEYFDGGDWLPFPKSVRGSFNQLNEAKEYMQNEWRIFNEQTQK